MSTYPLNNPADDMNNIWSEGEYTPSDVCRGIIDNHTKVNKNGMINSVGVEISSIQNYVNSKYLGRSGIPINSGFVNNIFSDKMIIKGLYEGESVSGLVIATGVADEAAFTSKRAMSFYTNGAPEDYGYSIRVLEEGDVSIPHLSSESANIGNLSFQESNGYSGIFDEVLIRGNYDGDPMIALNISGDIDNGHVTFTSAYDMKFRAGNDLALTIPTNNNCIITTKIFSDDIDTDYCDIISGYIQEAVVDKLILSGLVSDSDPIHVLYVSGNYGTGGTIIRSYNEMKFYTAHFGTGEGILAMTLTSEGNVSVDSAISSPIGNFTELSSELFTNTNLKISGNLDDNSTYIRNNDGGSLLFYNGYDTATPAFEIDAGGMINCYNWVKIYNNFTPNDQFIDIGAIGDPFADVYATGLILQNIVSYPNNAAALSAGEPVGTVYRSGDYLCIVH